MPGDSRSENALRWGARLFGIAGQRRKQQAHWTRVRLALLPSVQGTASDCRLAYDQETLASMKEIYETTDEGEYMRPTKEKI